MDFLQSFSEMHLLQAERWELTKKLNPGEYPMVGLRSMQDDQNTIFSLKELAREDIQESLLLSFRTPRRRDSCS